jgi:thiosulfate/3-mercaptopyruvate sulfurtransferase
MSGIMTRSRPLIGAKLLNEALFSRNSNIRVLETSFAAPGKGLESYLEQHIPKASFFDLWRCCHPTQFVTKPAHEPLCFQDYAQSLGVKGDNQVVIYDKGNIFFAARLWFTFKAFGHPNVSVLNGGFPSWLNKGYKVETGEDSSDTSERGDFVVRHCGGRLLSFDELQQVTKSAGQMVDVRDLGHFKGEKPEPSESTISALEAACQPLPEGMMAGHVPGARHINKDLFLEQDTKEIKGAAEIKKVLQHHGIDLNRPITAMCYNGVSACLIPLLGAEINKEDVSVYVGSWTEYGQRSTTCDVERGDGPANPPAPVAA